MVDGPADGQVEGVTGDKPCNHENAERNVTGHAVVEILEEFCELEAEIRYMGNVEGSRDS